MGFESFKPEVLLGSAVYALLGVVIFWLCFIVIDKLTPYNLWEEIVEKQNKALGMVVAAMSLGICIIVAAAIDLAHVVHGKFLTRVMLGLPEVADLATEIAAVSDLQVAMDKTVRREAPGQAQATALVMQFFPEVFDRSQKSEGQAWHRAQERSWNSRRRKATSQPGAVQGWGDGFPER